MFHTAQGPEKRCGVTSAGVLLSGGMLALFSFDVHVFPTVKMGCVTFHLLKSQFLKNPLQEMSFTPLAHL